MSAPSKVKNKNTPIDIDSIDLDLMKERTTDLPGLLEYAHSIGGFSVVPTKQGEIKGQAINAMKEQTESQMQQIFEQMQLLATQAAKLKKRAEISYDIYHATMRFKPVIGKTYYLYQSNSKTKILAMISPREWGESMPFKSFIATVKLLSDHTWEVLSDEELAKK